MKCILFPVFYESADEGNNSRQKGKHKANIGGIENSMASLQVFILLIVGGVGCEFKGGRVGM